MMARKKILAVPEGDMFLRRDAAILEKHFAVRAIAGFKPGLVRKKLIQGIPIVLRLFKGALSADLTFSWFADVDAFLVVLFSMMLRKKSVVVASGHSVANMPETNFGSMRGKISSRVVRFILRHATEVLAVSEFNRKEILRCIEGEKVRMVYHGVDSDEFAPGAEKQKNLAVTTSAVMRARLPWKGLETFVRSAKFLPEVDFVLIGQHMDDSVDYLRSIATSNVKFTGYVSLHELIDYYQRAKTYVQISAHEAFGIALAEAMLCECVPVVTDRGSLPEVVGDTGFYVPYGNPEETAKAISKALNSDKGKRARERIKKMFSMERRERELIMEIQRLLET